MLIASKYEEMYSPEVADFVYITDNAYTKADIRKMECAILETLDFRLGRPLALNFLRRFSKAAEVKQIYYFCNGVPNTNSVQFYVNKLVKF